VSWAAAFNPQRPSPRLRNPNADDLDRLVAPHHHLALCCCKSAPDEPAQHAAFESVPLDKERRVDARAAACKQRERPALLRTETRLLRGYRDCIRHRGNNGKSPAG
jgi:hypothetical protein